MVSLEEQLKKQAQQLGFELVGIAAATDADTFTDLEQWLDQEYAGEMHYMQRHREARRHPRSILAEVRSVIMVGMNYKPVEGQATTSSAFTGKVARYARGRDYHDVLRGRLQQLLAWLRQQIPNCGGRAIVDTAPLLERDFARRAGLGWFGKNTMLLHRELGSYFLLGALLADVELRPDVPFQTNHCGSCTACLQACPTAAFVAPGQLDARRCISYLTIELKTAIPEDLRADMGDWLFGCDICQEVCPWNRKAPPGQEAELLSRPELAAVDLVELLRLSEADFRQRFRDTPLTRPKRRGLLRNAAIALGNIGTEAALPVLEQAARDAEPLIREAALWAIERIRQRQREKSSDQNKEMEAVRVTIAYTEDHSPDHNPPD